MNWPNEEQLRHWWNIIHMPETKTKKSKLKLPPRVGRYI